MSPTCNMFIISRLDLTRLGQQNYDIRSVLLPAFVFSTTVKFKTSLPHLKKPNVVGFELSIQHLTKRSLTKNEIK